jgi:catechol 2,3-dioxygenase
MGTVALDLDAVMAELPAGDDGGMPEGTGMGHVHLQVAALDAAEPFYTGELGLDVTVRSYPGALFLSRGGYHHHVGLNVWASAGGPAPPEGGLGLAWVELDPGGERLVRDPSGNALLTR